MAHTQRVHARNPARSIMTGYAYKSEISEAHIGAEEYINNFRDPERFMEYCRQCPMYGKTWACPPYGFDMEEYLHGYRFATIIMARITPAEKGIPIAEAGRLLLPERIRLERMLLQAEKESGGKAFAFTGKCHYCVECTREAGLPCRHPEKVRPSLEACGFDIVKTATKLFATEIKWSSNSFVPEYLTLIGGLFHNSGSCISYLKL